MIKLVKSLILALAIAVYFAVSTPSVFAAPDIQADKSEVVANHKSNHHHGKVKSHSSNRKSRKHKKVTVDNEKEPVVQPSNEPVKEETAKAVDKTSEVVENK
jgi:hypothetical protein